jgi:hypothetical protein
MIHAALHTLAKHLDSRLQSHFDRQEELVELSPLVDPDGTIPEHIRNKMVLSVINLQLEAERRVSGLAPHRSATSGRIVQPPTPMSVRVMLAASFDKYVEALEFLSRSVAILQQTPIYKRSEFPDLPEGVDRLQVEALSLRASEQAAVWTALGAKYLPSMAYQIRGLELAPDVSEAG